MKKYAVYSGTRNLYSIMLPAVKSLLDNSDVDIVYLLIEDDVFPYPIPDCVKTINVSNQMFFKPGSPNYSCSWTYMALLRAAYCYIFPDIDRILCLDVDTIVLHDISPIWGYDLTDYYLAGVAEPDKALKDSPYVNMGVTLHNLEKLRDGRADHLIDILNTSPFCFPEQDVFNIYCAGHVLEIAPEFNVSVCTKPAKQAWVRHFAAEPKSKWTASSEFTHYKSLDWNEVLHGRK